jgi:hypothetical protein
MHYARSELSVSWRGPAGSVTQTELADYVVRIDYEGLEGSELVVNGVDYPLVRDWRSPARAPRVIRYWHLQNHWACSSTDSLSIEIDQPTAAIRARWTHDGATTEWVVPAWGRAPAPVVELGKINCGGTTLPPAELRKGGRLELFAIRVDGSELPIAGLPKFIFTPMLPTIGFEQEEDFILDAPAEPERSGRYLYLLGGLALLVGAALALWRARERATKSV